VKLALEEAFRIAGMYNPAIADELATLIAEVQEAMNNIIDQEVPDCNPAGEPW
jgi:predicted choloylglycine hydrolase